MILETVYNLGVCQNAPVRFVGIWKDYHYDIPGANDGSTVEFDNPEAAFASAREGASSTGFTSVSYWIEAKVGEDITVETIDGYEGTT